MSYFQPDSLPYNTAPYYWLAVAGMPSSAIAELEMHGFHVQGGGDVFLTRVPCPWHDAWHVLEMLIDRFAGLGASEKKLRVAVIPEQEEPTSLTIEQNLKAVSDIRHIADSLWLGDALLADRVVCYLQPVQDRRGKVFGYESFARVQLEGEHVIGGGQIFAASKALKLEYRLDRYLHQKAVEAFVASGADNRLFINFQAGFIHRPEVYLEGLNQAVKKYSVPERNIVLDFTQSESQQNTAHLKAICQYCRQQGYSISLDDIMTAKNLEVLVPVVQPDFIKLDLELTRRAVSDEGRTLISQMVEVAHRDGITVIAEGIETQDIYHTLMQQEVDLFQGYYIGHPAPYVGQPPAKAMNN